MRRATLAVTLGMLGIFGAACSQIFVGGPIGRPPATPAFPGNAMAIEGFAAQQARLLHDPAVRRVYVIVGHDRRTWRGDNIHPPSSDAYLIVLRGRFRCTECSTDGPKVPTGTLAVWNVSRRGLRVSSFWLTRRSPRLSALGRVYVLPVPPAQVVVPKLTPMYVQDAEDSVRAAGLRVVIASIPPIRGADASVNGYAIRGQFPAPGTRVAAGTPVVLRLAYSVNGGLGGVGRPGVVPDLVGLPINRAISAATAVGLHVTVPAVTHRVASDAVTGQSRAPGSRVRPGDVITLTL